MKAGLNQGLAMVQDFLFGPWATFWATFEGVISKREEFGERFGKKQLLRFFKDEQIVTLLCLRGKTYLT